MSRCFFTKPAIADLRSIAAHIRKDSARAAKRVVAEIRNVCKETLATFPVSGTACDELSPGLRCFSVGNYVIFFRATNPVEITRVLHGAMDITSRYFK
ncbi:MAG TPA: type II toxin-antitoxin system RelE/ParE family toxin [Pirellulaceae bacterium]|nr:type II toxin-antitoxin system RelE/ParE family toxin [Pirellulaceae bacterium]